MDRIAHQNMKAVINREQPSVLLNDRVGSIGAVDGTYGMRPNCNCAVTANVTAEVL